MLARRGVDFIGRAKPRGLRRQHGLLGLTIATVLFGFMQFNAESSLLGALGKDSTLTGRTFLWTHPPPGMGLTKFAPYGYPLWVCYAVWGAIVALLYPACRWYGELKRRRSDWWLSYL